MINKTKIFNSRDFVTPAFAESRHCDIATRISNIMLLARVNRRLDDNCEENRISRGEVSTSDESTTRKKKKQKIRNFDTETVLDIYVGR